MEHKNHQYAKTLGLSEDIIKDMDSMGHKALMNRAISLGTPGHKRLVSMVYQFGRLLDEKRKNQEPFPNYVQAAAIVKLADMHGVNPELALNLVGAVMETYKFTIHRLARGDYGNADTGYENTAGGPAQPARNEAGVSNQQ